jgi:rhodanese-related sulfurtransferase
MEPVIILRNLFIPFFVCAIFACDSGKQEKEVVSEQVKNENLKLNPVAFKEHLKANQGNYIILDVRTPEEYEQGAIAGAVNANINDDSFENKINELDKQQAVYVYCAAGGRSGRAAQRLQEKGFTRIIDLKGGYNAYKRKEQKKQ